MSKENELGFKKYETEIKNYLEFSFGEDKVKYQTPCGKYDLEFVLFDEIYIEVDKNRHDSYDLAKEKERQKYIEDNTNYYTIKYNPQQQKPYELILDIIDACDKINYPYDLD